MEYRTQIKKLSLWIFIIPFIAINLCLFISVNYQIFDNTFLSVDQIGRSGPTFPYFDGGVSISRTARTYPTFLIFKPSMFLASVLLIMYWIKTNNLINSYQNTQGVNNRFNWLRRNQSSLQNSYQGIKISFANPILNKAVNGNSNGLTNLG